MAKTNGRAEIDGQAASLVVVSRTLEVSPEDAWRVLDDFGAIYRFHPAVERSPVVNGIDSGLGAERVCHFAGGNAIRERVVDHRPGEALTIEIVDAGKFPIRRALATFEVRPAGSGGSSVNIRMRFIPKFGLLGRLMAWSMMRSQFRKALDGLLGGLETHVRTGEVVGRRASA